MPTGLIYSERFLEHDTGLGHPERADRLRAIVDKLKAVHLWGELRHLSFEPADRKWIERLHAPAYVDRLFAACDAGARNMDVPDTTISPASAEIAQLAVGGVLTAVDAVMAGEISNAFCAVRPPGHHAEHDRSMGFCLFNNVAIAADYLLHRHGLDRVAVVDFDVHHGNGTQHLFESRGDVLVISLHEHPMHLYPGTGYSYETGTDQGEGCTLNIPLDPGSGDAEYRHAMLSKVVPALERFEPQFLLVSAGFDASEDDPLAHMAVKPRGFEWMTRRLKAEAERLCAGRLVSCLEGGYDLRSLAESVALHIHVLSEPAGHDGMMAMKAGF